jgi:hypothetical protein
MFINLHQQAHAVHFRGTMKRTGNQWCQDITTVLWTQWTALWQLRNEVIHGRNSMERQQQKEKETLRKLRHVYSQREFMEPSVQNLLFDDINDHEKMPPYALQNWLSVHEAVILQSIKSVSRRAIQGVRSIKSYFTAAPQTRPLEQQSHVEDGEAGHGAGHSTT